MRKVIVTGGAGFIGTHLLHALQNLADAEALDLALPGGIDILDRKAVERAVACADTVIHLAAVSSVGEALANPSRCAAVNVDGTRTVLEAARKARVRRVVFASSAAVYGEARKGWASRESDRLAPACIYGHTKRLGEQVVEEYAGRNRSAVALRFFNVYGPSQLGGVVPAMLRAAASGEPIYIHGSPDVSRDFVHVRDVVRAIIHYAFDFHGTGVYNVGTGKTTTLGTLAAAVCMLTRSKSSIRVTPTQDCGVRRSLASTEKAARTGFSAQHSLRQGLVELIPF